MVCHLLIISFVASSDRYYLLDIIVDVAVLRQVFLSPPPFFIR